MTTDTLHRKSHILIVDDKKQNLTMIGNILKDAGEFEIRLALDGKTALRSARTYPPDLILLDIVMSGMDGFEVCAALKASPETREIPIIFLTAERFGTAGVVRGFECGGADYIVKPCSEAELLARIRTHIKLKQTHDRLRESETRYRAVVDDMTELVCRFRPDTTIIFVNEAYCRYFGKPAEALLGTSILDLMVPEDQDMACGRLKSLSPQEPILTYEHQVINANGEIRWQHWTDRATFDEAGALEEIQSVGRDVTERVYAQEAYHNLVDHSFQGMAILQDQRFVFANPKLARITGYPTEALTTMTSEDSRALIHPRDLETVERAIRETDSGASTEQQLIARLIRKDGDIRWLDIHLTHVSFWGSPSVQAAIMDITRIKELENLYGEDDGLGSLIGGSKPMRHVYMLIKQLASTDISVLITGETGTGKELVAEALHQESSRAHGPIVRVNCVELAENLIESELFGHVQGAFTGADRAHNGRFQMAHKGTLFLDEIGELPPRLQVKLLRAIEHREIQRLGATRPTRLDVRIIAATNVDMEQEIQSGRFREDLYFRLKGARIHLPPLRERRADIPALLDHFIKRYCTQNKTFVYQIRDDVVPLLQSYYWPGNVRELKHAAESACAFCRSTLLSPADFPPEIRDWDALDSGPDPDLDSPSPIASGEAAKILETLEKTRWHKSRAAQQLGISRSTLYRKIREYGLEGPD